MIRELYQIRKKEICLNITNGVVDSVRKKNVTESGCRVYHNGCIGIAGVLGEPTEETWRKAVNALEAQVPYPYEPTGAQVRTRAIGEMPDEAQLITTAERLLETLKKEFPEYVLSNKICAVEETVLLKNDLGLLLEDTQRYVFTAILIKEEASPNVFDSFIPWSGRTLDEDAILRTSREILSAHRMPVELPAERTPVLMNMSVFIEALGDYLNAQKLKKGASLLSGKAGMKVFSEQLGFSACLDEESYTFFFDAEGTVLPDDRLPLIQNGVVLRGIADKRYAAECGVDSTACASGGYDDTPAFAVEENRLCLEGTGTIAQLLSGRDAILLVLAQGGDITAAGDYATPVQTAYLYRDGHLTGRLPEFHFRGNIFDLLGKDYIGCSTDTGLDNNRLVVLYGKTE